MLARRLNKAEVLADTFTQFHLFKCQEPEVAPQFFLEVNKDCPPLSLHELALLETEYSSIDEIDKLEYLVRLIKSHNDCLFGLSQILHDSAKKGRPSFRASQNFKSSNQELFEISASPRITDITEEHPSLKKRLHANLKKLTKFKMTSLRPTAITRHRNSPTLTTMIPRRKIS